MAQDGEALKRNAISHISKDRCLVRGVERVFLVCGYSGRPDLVDDAVICESLAFLENTYPVQAGRGRYLVNRLARLLTMVDGSEDSDSLLRTPKNFYGMRDLVITVRANVGDR